ncbi:MAG: thiamine biosynthesis protein ApbE [Rhodopirellula sp.]|nr:thiamine biosynthesis protein ApbE [Rhodopirellula sp.]
MLLLSRNPRYPFSGWRLRRVLLVGFLALALGGCNQPPSLIKLSGPAQGTTWHVTFWQPGSPDGEAIRQDVVAELARVDALMSNYRSDSVIERFNRAGASEVLEVGPEIVNLIAKAREVTKASRGCYDLTIKPVFDLWGFSGQQVSVPSETELRNQLQIVGIDHVVARSGNTLAKSVRDLQVDLSSIAQGYTVKKMADVLESAGIEHYLVELGGELKSRGHKLGGEPWRVAIERPTPEERSIHKVITIRSDTPLSVMISGTYRHYFDDQGQRHSHVLDARTGWPVSHSTVSVTVIDQDPTRADAWSTALLCLGAREGTAVADQHDIAALFIEKKNNQLSETTTEAWHVTEGIAVD